MTGDRAGAIALTAATGAALAWANAAPASYAHAVHTAVPGLRHVGLHFDARDVVNQLLMTAFFFLAGLEIRREIAAGELRTWRRAAVPVTAALTGMAVPAVLYALAIARGAGGRGWGIPMATDVAFAVGALALAGPGVSPRVRIFLLTLAVADDVASIAVLVFFSSSGVHGLALGTGVVAAAALAIPGPQHRSRVAVAVLAVMGWWALARAGAEAAVIGAALGLAVQHARAMERRLGPVVLFAVLPLFALANTGVHLRDAGFASGAAGRVFVAIVVARVVGKPLGIMLGAALAPRVAGDSYDPGLAPRAVAGAGAAAGVGFTVPLLIIRAVFGDGRLATGATAGLLAGSALCAVEAAVILRRYRRPVT